MKKLAQRIRVPNEGKIFLGLIKDTLRRAGKADILTMAGSLAFTTVLSLVPIIAVAFYVFKVFGGLDYAYEKLMPFLLEALSEGTGEVVAGHLDQFIRQVHAKALGWAGIAGLIFTAVSTYLTVVSSFNKIWEVDRPRSLQHRVLRAILLLTAGPALMVTSVVLTTAVATQVANIPFSGQLIAFLLSTILFTMVYALVPMVEVPFKVIIFGSLFPALLLEIAKYGYALYTSKVVSYSAFYGSFAAIPLFLIWIYIAWVITLLGAVWVRTLQIYFKRGRIVL